MPRRGENIYKRKDGRWEGRVLKPDGKYLYIYAKTYKDVKEKKKFFQNSTRLTAMKNTKNVLPAAESFKAWLREDLFDRVKPSTYESYYRCVTKYVIPFFEKPGNERITEQKAGEFVKRIDGDGCLSNSYKRKILSIFKTALRAILKGSNEFGPILNAVTIPKATDPNVQVFSVREQRLIEKEVMRSKNRQTIGILLCFYTGIRLGEICALKWGDIDFEAGTMSISRTVSRTKNFQGKGGKTVLNIGMPKSRKSVRIIPLPAFLLKFPNQLGMDVFNENDYVLTNSDKPLEPRNYQKLFQKILKNAGVKARKFHAIRHTFATRSLELGIDIKTLSEILGHANVSITLNIYAHSLFEQKKQAMDKLNEMYFTHIKSSFAVRSPVMDFQKSERSDCFG
jgi:integrase